MATEADIEVVEDNDATAVFTCTLDGTAINLTGATIEFFLKPDKATDEGAAGVVRYATDTGEVTILVQSGATLGQCQVQMDRTDLAVPGKHRYRLDVTQAGRKLTYAYGRVIVVDV